MTDSDRERPGPRLQILGITKRGAPLSQVAKAVLATAILLIGGGLIVPSTLTATALTSQLPFFAVLAVASIGQHLVIQQRGLDLSVAGILSFAAVIVSALPSRGAGLTETLAYVALALGVGLFVGGLNGFLVSFVRVPALVTTLGMNSLTLGATMWLTRGFSQPVPPPLNSFGLTRVLGVPATVLVMIAITAIAAVVLSQTAVGRRFIATSVNPGAATAVGIRLDLYRMATYTLAGACYASAGILLASTVVAPTVFSGLPYLLASVAAVVIGGNSIGGGMRGSVVATVIGALFLSYLNQFVLSVGFGTAHQSIVQAVIIVASFAVPELARRWRIASSAR
jgi:ribose/xylose/arabinose/galactoside ABC-type transport system permease subunit